MGKASFVTYGITLSGHGLVQFPLLTLLKSCPRFSDVVPPSLAAPPPPPPAAGASVGWMQRDPSWLPAPAGWVLRVEDRVAPVGSAIPGALRGMLKLPAG